jgi:hypothetical protein
MEKQAIKTTSIENSVIYDRVKNKAKIKFKAGDKPSCSFNGEILNNKINWVEVAKAILGAQQIKISQLSKKIGVTTQGLELVLKNNLQFLTFRAGAILLSIYEKQTSVSCC